MPDQDDHSLMWEDRAGSPSSAEGERLSGARGVSSSTRRDILRAGTKLVFVAPMVLTFSARDALAAGSNQSCYPTGHACPGAEPCCNGLTCNSGVCGDPCEAAGKLCFVPSDCCSGNCQLGVCQ